MGVDHSYGNYDGVDVSAAQRPDLYVCLDASKTAMA